MDRNIAAGPKPQVLEWAIHDEAEGAPESGEVGGTGLSGAPTVQQVFPFAPLGVYSAR